MTDVVVREVKISPWERILRWKDALFAVVPTPRRAWARTAAILLAFAIAASAGGLLLYRVGKWAFKPEPQFPIGMADPPTAKPKSPGSISPSNLRKPAAPGAQRPTTPRSAPLPWGFDWNGDERKAR